MTTSHIRQNYLECVEDAVNKQINYELKASMAYMSMSTYFHRADVALDNIGDWFAAQSDEERTHAKGLMKYQNRRGGRVVISGMAEVEKQTFKNALEAFEYALELEKGNNTALLRLHDIATKAEDKDLAVYLEDKYLSEQVESIEEIGRFVTKLKQVGDGMGEVFFDKEIITNSS
uniref:Ferritin n=1 Tax=Rhabditophanes sp. KR3021 TaxID=114890 RepID=A0AC35U295_9BILA